MEEQIERMMRRGGGPKTDNGKAVSRKNAIKHGLLSQEVLFQKEDEGDLAALCSEVTDDLKPVNKLEYILVDRIVSNLWRLKRILSMEEGGAIHTMFDLSVSNNADIYLRYETMLERSIYKAMHELERVQAKRLGEVVPLPVVGDIVVDDNRQFVS